MEDEARQPVGRANPVLTGTAFTQAIAGLKDASRGESVFTRVGLRFGADDQDVRWSNASLHTNTHWNNPQPWGQQIWTQGMLDTGKGNTAYFGHNGNQVVPQTLTLDRATLEGRAMKALAQDGYDSTAKISATTDQEAYYAGGLAIGSHLEEVTAKRGLNYNNVGSAMRAAVMARKWEMKRNGVTSVADFATEMRQHFPQLGKESEGDGASVLWEKTRRGHRMDPANLASPTPTELHLGDQGTIHQAHRRAQQAAGERFNAKFARFSEIASAQDVSPEQKRETIARELGRWWIDKGADVDTVRQLPKNTVEQLLFAQDRLAALSNSYVKRKLNRHGIVHDHQSQARAGHQLPDVPVPKRGAAFLRGIADLAGDGAQNTPEVFARLQIPYRGAGNSARMVSNFGTFSTKTRQSEDGDAWTQGMMEPSGGTKYFGDNPNAYGGAVPQNLSLKRARMEARAMKYLSGVGYQPKDNDIQAQANEAAHYGELAMGSFLEDITGQRALGFRDVGSAMRATTLAAKWTMLNGDQQPVANFGRNLRDAFPQLGKQSWGEGWGASNLAKDLANPAKRQGVIDRHTDTIAQAHLDAQAAALGRFDRKFARFSEIASSNALNEGQKMQRIREQLGGWWHANAERLDGLRTMPTGNPDLDRAQGQRHTQLSNDYIVTKMAKHGVSVYHPDTRERLRGFEA